MSAIVCTVCFCTVNSLSLDSHDWEAIPMFDKMGRVLLTYTAVQCRMLMVEVA